MTFQLQIVENYTATDSTDLTTILPSIAFEERARARDYGAHFIDRCEDLQAYDRHTPPCDDQVGTKPRTDNSGINGCDLGRASWLIT